MMTLEEIREAVRDEIGALYELIRDEQVDRWANRGQAQLALRVGTKITLSWADGAASVSLPADCVAVDRLVSMTTCLPEHVRIGGPVGGSLAFLDPASVAAGEADLYYQADLAKITGSSASLGSSLADEAIISYALSRFYRRVAGSRADYRRYSTITGQNGVDVADLEDLADAHFRDFVDARERLVGSDPATFYGD